MRGFFPGRRIILPKFFVPPEAIGGGRAVIDGENARHIGRVLRMRPGDEVTLCDGAGQDYICRLTDFTRTEIGAEVLRSEPCAGEPALAVTLFMCLPKADKLEWIVQKAVELGVAAVVPVLSRNCVAKADPAAAERKQARLQQIAREAAAQSGRGVIPQIGRPVPLEEAVRRMAAEYDNAFFLYEADGGTAADKIGFLADSPGRTAACLVGPEGGFAPEEAALCRQAGLITVGLGKRILRCETAPITFLSILMYLSGNI